MNESTYKDNLDAEEQIAAEEEIASIIMHQQEKNSGFYEPTLDEEDCAELGRLILMRVLHRFRPELLGN